MCAFDPATTPALIRGFVLGDRAFACEKIKENRVRTVWRVIVPEHGTFLLKHYRYLRTYDRLRYQLVHDKAEREARNLRRLRALGIPVPRAFHAERLAGGAEAFFVGEFLPEASAWPLRPSAALVRKLARSIRRLHRVGFFHSDLHLGNVLLCGTQIYLIDFHGGFFVPFIPRSVELKLLGSLVSSLLARGQEKEVEVFLSEYGFPLGSPFREKVKSFGLRYHRRHLASRARRCVVNSTSFAVEKEPQRVVFRLRCFARSDLDAALRRSGSVLAANRRGDVTLVPVGETRVCRKRVHYSWLRGAVARFFGGRLAAAWRGANALVVHGVGTVVPLAYVTIFKAGALKQEVFITEELSGFTSLTDLLRSLSPDQRRQCVRSLVGPVAQFITAFHQTGFWLHDLAPKNIMVKRCPDGTWNFKLVDLDRMKRSGLHTRRRFRNLIQLGCIPEVPIRWLDRARFLKAYQGGAYWTLRVCALLKEGILAEMEKLIVRQSMHHMAPLINPKHCRSPHEDHSQAFRSRGN